MFEGSSHLVFWGFGVRGFSNFMFGVGVNGIKA